jgi:hypothetical protein
MPHATTARRVGCRDQRDAVELHQTLRDVKRHRDVRAGDVLRRPHCPRTHVAETVAHCVRVHAGHDGLHRREADERALLLHGAAHGVRLQRGVAVEHRHADVARKVQQLLTPAVHLHRDAVVRRRRLSGEERSVKPHVLHSCQLCQTPKSQQQPTTVTTQSRSQSLQHQQQ